MHIILRNSVHAAAHTTTRAQAVCFAVNYVESFSDRIEFIGPESAENGVIRPAGINWTVRVGGELRTFEYLSVCDDDIKTYDHILIPAPEDLFKDMHCSDIERMEHLPLGDNYQASLAWEAGMNKTIAKRQIAASKRLHNIESSNE